MATKYRTDLGQAPEPQMANPATIARAYELGAKATSQTIEALGGVYEAYRDYDIASTKDDEGLTADELAGQFMLRNQAAEGVKRLEADRAMVEKKSAMSIFQDEGKTPELSDNTATLLAGYDAEITRLKEAAQGGMSNEQYVARIDAVTKKAIAKYPGLSDKIRERVGIVTGMPYADRWSQMQYVRERFSKQDGGGAKTADELAANDIKRWSAYGSFGSAEQLFKLRAENPTEYANVARAASQYEATKTNLNAIETDVKGRTAVSDNEFTKMTPSFMAIYNGALGTDVIQSRIRDEKEIYTPVLELMAKGEDVTVNPAAFKVQIDMHAARMRTSIEGARTAALNQIREAKIKNPDVSEAKYKEAEGYINSQADRDLQAYADDKGHGVVLMAGILSKHRDKSLSEQQQLYDLALKQQSAMQNNPLVSQYWAGGEKQERLKIENKYFYDYMVESEKFTLNALKGIRSNTDSAVNLSKVSTILDQAKKDPTAVPPSPVEDAAVRRAANDALMATATTVMKKVNLDPADINTISSALSTATQDGNATQLLSRDYKMLGERLSKLSDVDLGLIKGNVSNTAMQTVDKVVRSKQEIETKYGVTLVIGSNDSGEVSVVRQQVPAGTSPNDTTIATYNRAAAEFINKNKPLLTNIVYGRAMLTGEQPKAVGTDFASVISNNQPYRGFYSLQPTVPSTAGAGRGSVNPTTVVNNEPAATTPTTTTSKSPAWWRE